MRQTTTKMSTEYLFSDIHHGDASSYEDTDDMWDCKLEEIVSNYNDEFCNGIAWIVEDNPLHIGIYESERGGEPFITLYDGHHRLLAAWLMNIPEVTVWVSRT